MSYRIAAPDEYLAITGMGIKTIKITQAAWVLPLQRCVQFSILPANYATEIQAMTREKLQFHLPVVYTIGPDVSSRNGYAAQQDDVLVNDRERQNDALLKYAMLLAESNEENGASSQNMQQIVKGIIEGEGHRLVSGMTIEEIITNHQVFKRRLYDVVQQELWHLGLRIFDAHVASYGSVLDPFWWKGGCSGTGNTALTNLSRAQNLDDKQSGAKYDYESTDPELTIPIAEPDLVQKLNFATIDRTQTLALQEAEAEPSLSWKRRDDHSLDERWEAYSVEFSQCFRNIYSGPGAVDTSSPYMPLHRGSQIDTIINWPLDDNRFKDVQKGFPAGSGFYYRQGDNRPANLRNDWMASSTYARAHSFSPSLSKLIIGACIVWGLGVPIVQAQRVPDWLLHTVGGMTIAASACLPALQAVEDKTDVKAYWTGLCIAWAISFTVFIGMELYQRRDQTRLLLGLVAFCGVNLLGSLPGNSSSTVETIKGWGPLALSLSLWVVPEWIQLMGAPRVAESFV